MPTDPSAFVMGSLVEAGIQGGVPIMVFENAPTFLLPQNTFWFGPAGLRARLERARYCVETADNVDCSRLRPFPVAQRRIRSLIVAARGVARVGLAAALETAMVRPDRAWRVDQEFPGTKTHYSHPFTWHSPAVHRSNAPSFTIKCNCCEPVGFDRPAGYVPRGLQPDTRIFSPEDCARLQGLEPDRAWPALRIRCRCPHCRPKRVNGYHPCARGRQTGNAVAGSYARFVASVIGPLLREIGVPRAELRYAGLQGW